MKITIDRESCTACAVCWETCSDVFEASPEDNYSQIVESYRMDGRADLGNVPDALSKCAIEAAEGCPVQIIHVEKT